MLGKFSAIVVLIIAGCDIGGKAPAGMTDAGPDVVLEPVTPLDAAPCGNGNGGIGTLCTDPAKDCPPEDPCWFFVCEPGAGETKVCAGKAKDGGPQ
jgi:hypothetical protein